MGQHRMFANAIVDSDAFTGLSVSAQALYFHLGMRADDDGFVNKPRQIARAIKAEDEDLEELSRNKFIIIFPSGIVCVKHWRINNTIRKDRYKPTLYQEEFRRLRLKENDAYTLDTDGLPIDNQVTTNCQPNDNQWLPQGKVRQDNARQGKGSNGTPSFLELLEEI